MPHLFFLTEPRVLNKDELKGYLEAYSTGHYLTRKVPGRVIVKSYFRASPGHGGDVFCMFLVETGATERNLWRHRGNVQIQRRKSSLQPHEQLLPLQM